MSVDPAHSLGDSFDLETGLFHQPRPAIRCRSTESLSIHEVNIQKEIKRHWRGDLLLRGFGAAHHRHQRRGGGGTGHPARHGRAERDDVHQPVPAREPLRRHRAGCRAHGRIHALRQHADHARVVHEAHLPVPARAAEGGPADGQPRLAGGTADGQLLRQYPGPVRQAGGHRRTAGRPAHHQRAAGHQPGEDGAARDPARLRLLLAARAHGGRRHRQPRAAGRRSPTPGSTSGAPRSARFWTRSRPTSRRCR